MSAGTGAALSNVRRLVSVRASSKPSACAALPWHRLTSNLSVAVRGHSCNTFIYSLELTPRGLLLLLLNFFMMSTCDRRIVGAGGHMEGSWNAAEYIGVCRDCLNRPKLSATWMSWDRLFQMVGTARLKAHEDINVLVVVWLPRPVRPVNFLHVKHRCPILYKYLIVIVIVNLLHLVLFNASSELECAHAEEVQQALIKVDSSGSLRKKMTKHTHTHEREHWRTSCES